MRKNLICFWSSVTALTLLTFPAKTLAHPGHSLGDADLQHLLGSPDHFLALSLAGLLLAGTGWLIRGKKSARTLQFVGVGLCLTAALCWTLRL